MNGDLISRSALLKDIENYCGDYLKHGDDAFDKTAVRMVIKAAPAVDADSEYKSSFEQIAAKYAKIQDKMLKGELVEVDMVAQMLCDAIGDPYACDVNSNDEWLPMVCDNQNECPDVKDRLYCWKQFIKHYGERRTDDAD